MGIGPMQDGASVPTGRNPSKYFGPGFALSSHCIAAQGRVYLKAVF
jgi:hypothetical protein